MPDTPLILSLLPDRYTVCRLDPQAPIPLWGLDGPFVSITRTDDELSLVCAQRHVPSGTICERDWRCLKVEGPLDFGLTGILAALTAPLAQAQISVFAIATYDTDYLLVKEGAVGRAIGALEQHGYRVR